jgi:hypothetical protein
MPEVYTFPEVRAAAAKVSIRSRLYIFDGGETIELTDEQGKQLARITSLWGDPSAPDQTAKWLMENTTLTVFDFAKD